MIHCHQAWGSADLSLGCWSPTGSAWHGPSVSFSATVWHAMAMEYQRNTNSGTIRVPFGYYCSGPNGPAKRIKMGHPLYGTIMHHPNLGSLKFTHFSPSRFALGNCPITGASLPFPFPFMKLKARGSELPCQDGCLKDKRLRRLDDIALRKRT